MRNRNLHSVALSLCLVLGWQAAPALGQMFNSNSDGTDGPLSVTAADMVIDLASAATGPWDTTPHTMGVGVYDPVQWAVVFHYTDITIDAGFKVTFMNHPKGAPVVWLATGTVTINGNVVLNGANGINALGSTYAIPGPGGFSGGIGRLGGSAGFGPGGGGFSVNGGGGSYGGLGDPSGGLSGVTYGMKSVLPLIGGSGGGGSTFNNWGGGAGGGAILIASSMNIVVDGGISARGGEGVNNNVSGSGSGGGIRLIANDISGSGLLDARGGTGGIPGGDGRIRVEATTISLSTSMPPFNPGPAVIQSIPVPVFPAASAPVLRVKTINGKTIPTDPSANVLTPEVAIGASFPVNIVVELSNMPTAAGTVVDVRIVQAAGGISQTVQTMPLVDDGTGTGDLTATAVFDFTSPGSWEVQLSLPLP